MRPRTASRSTPARLDQLALEDLRLLALPLLDPVVRAAVLDDVSRAAATAGRVARRRLRARSGDVGRDDNSLPEPRLPGATGMAAPDVFVVMAIVAFGVAFVTGVAQLAIGLVVGILGARRRGGDQGFGD